MDTKNTTELAPKSVTVTVPRADVVRGNDHVWSRLRELGLDPRTIVKAPVITANGGLEYTGAPISGSEQDDFR